MPTLESLKAEHPEWCWNCEEMRAHRQPCAFRPHPVISALTAAKQEDEATIREQETRIAELERVVCTGCWDDACRLTTEQQAHAATKEELAEAYFGAWYWRDFDRQKEPWSEVNFNRAERAYRAALGRQAQRAADAAKEE